MATAADLVAAARRHLTGGGRAALNRLGAGIDGSIGTLTTALDAANIQAGAYLSIGLEVLYVWSVDVSSKQVTVQRGMLGSTPAPHAANDIIYVNPRFSDFEIFSALNDDLLDLSAPSNGLYRISMLDITARSGVYGYDFPAVDLLSVADVRWQVPGVAAEWREVSDFTVNADLPTSAFPSGTAIFMRGAIPGQTYRVRYRARLSPLTALTDDATVTGLASTALDIPPLGAAVRLMAGRPIGRAETNSQGDTRRADEVRVGEIVQAPAALRALRAERIAAEATRLAQTWENRLRPRVAL